uniref:GUN4-like domain-containing protein n=1 Tax=Chondria sp. (in: red algae) TaxID=1982705 RepID=A0A1Z1MQT5_9FLOR|nr:hypothetical protein [Chondria sp. (in: red algae)]
MTNIKSKQIEINKQVQSIITKNFIRITSDIEETINSIYQEKQEVLLEIIIQRILHNKQNADTLDGFIFQKLLNTNIKVIKDKLNNYFPDGVATLKPSLQINYQPLQDILINQKFQEADKLTSQYLCELVEIKTNYKKNWLYFTDIQFMPSEDLFTLDLLWKIYSKGKFGLSIQKKIWTSNNKKWEKLWEKIGWTDNGNTKRYPNEFIWTLDAPQGHLPLSNQLRGTKTLLYLFNKITWN